MTSAVKTFAARDLLAGGIRIGNIAESSPELLGQAKAIEELHRGDDVWIRTSASTGIMRSAAISPTTVKRHRELPNITRLSCSSWEPLVGREMLKARKHWRGWAKGAGWLAVRVNAE